MELNRPNTKLILKKWKVVSSTSLAFVTSLLCSATHFASSVAVCATDMKLCSAFYTCAPHKYRSYAVGAQLLVRLRCVFCVRGAARMDVYAENPHGQEVSCCRVTNLRGQTGQLERDKRDDSAAYLSPRPGYPRLLGAPWRVVHSDGLHIFLVVRKRLERWPLSSTKYQTG